MADEIIECQVHEHLVITCPHCGHEGRMCLTPAKPSDGDMTFCPKCFEVATIERDVLRLPTEVEMNDFNADGNMRYALERLKREGMPGGEATG